MEIETNVVGKCVSAYFIQALRCEVVNHYVDGLGVWGTA